MVATARKYYNILMCGNDQLTDKQPFEGREMQSALETGNPAECPPPVVATKRPRLEDSKISTETVNSSEPRTVVSLVVKRPLVF